MLSAWMLGRNTQERIIATSYNDELAQSFSMYTRNTIQEEKNTSTQIVYSDIFPDTKIKKGDASFKRWSVEGSFFSYKGAGVGGTITGQGGTCLIVDDPCKSAEDAFNENSLEKKWEWFTGTLLSRQEKGAIKIINHTPWAFGDIGGKLQSGDKKDDYYVFRRPAWNGKKMLCEEILDKQGYDDLKALMPDSIFSANYDCIRLNAKNLLYGEGFKLYDKLPEEYDGRNCFIDTADTGSDFLCAIWGLMSDKYFYVCDILFTQEPIEVTEEETARRMIEFKTREARIESNSGGRSFSYHVEKILDEEYNWQGTIFDDFQQDKNKETRIMVMSGLVKDRIIFPKNWKIRWPVFYDQVTKFQKVFKDNKHDDGPDTLTQIVEYMFSGGDEGPVFIKRRSNW